MSAEAPELLRGVPRQEAVAAAPISEASASLIGVESEPAAAAAAAAAVPVSEEQTETPSPTPSTAFATHAATAVSVEADDQPPTQAQAGHQAPEEERPQQQPQEETTPPPPPPPPPAIASSTVTSYTAAAAAAATLRWFPNIWRTQTAQYAQIWVKHARVYEQLAKDITDFQLYVGEDVFARLETARREGHLTIAKVHQALVELDRFDQRILRQKGTPTQTMIGFDYDGLLEGWQRLSHHLCSDPELLPKGEDSFYHHLIQYKAYFDEARVNRLRVLQVLEAHSRQQIVNIQTILDIYLRLLGLSEPEIVDLTASASSNSTLISPQSKVSEMAPRPQDSLVQKDPGYPRDGLWCFLTVELTGKDKETTMYYLENTGDFIALDSAEVELTTCVTLQIPEYGLSKHDHMSLWSLLNQLIHIEEFYVDSLDLRVSLPLSHICCLLQMINPAQVRKIVVQRACWEDASSAQLLGGIVAGFPQCRQFSCCLVEDATLDDLSRIFQIFEPNSREEAGTERFILSRQTGDINGLYHVQHTRFDASEADIIPWALRNHCLLEHLSSRFNNNGSSNLDKLVTLRLDMIDQIDQNIFLQPLLDLMMNYLPSFRKLGLYNVQTTKGFLDPLLMKGVQYSHLTHFTCHIQESNKYIFTNFAPLLQDLIRKHVYLEHLDVQGTGFSLDLGWEKVRDMYVKLNQCGRRLLHSEDAALEQLITVLHNARDDLTCIYYFLSHKPSLWTESSGHLLPSVRPSVVEAEVPIAVFYRH